MANIKQYLENSWYRGASQDRQTGYAAQYQYGYGVNTRDMKNGVCLAGGATDSDTQYNDPFSFFTYGGFLYYVDADGKIYDDEGTEMCDTGVTHIGSPRGIEFGDSIYIVGTGGVIKVTGWNATNITSSFPTYNGSGYRGLGSCVLNYANTFLLIGDLNVVWKIDTAGIISGIRYFESSYNVFGLTQEGNYLKIYTSNGINTKIHYAKGTFDAEYTGLVQTVSLTGLSVNIGDVTSDQGNDYVIFKVEDGYNSPLLDYKLSKISGYNKTDIRRTQKWDGTKVFTSPNPTITACDGVVFAAMQDGIWTFTEYNGWLWGGNCEFPIASNERIHSIFRYGERLYACIYNTTSSKYTLRYHDMSFHPATYQPSGYIIGRVFDGGCGSLFKKNLQSTVTYNMPTGTSLELSYRYDRSSFGYDKSNFLSVKTMADTNSCYDIVVPTTDNDFNKARNYIEYRVDLTTSDTTKTPILFEHNLLYNDSMRKYR